MAYNYLEIYGIQLIIKLSLEYIHYLQISHWIHTLYYRCALSNYSLMEYVNVFLAAILKFKMADLG